MKRLAATLVLALAAGACTGGDDAVTREPVADASAGGRIVIAIDRPRTIDPQATDRNDAGASLVVETMCDRLVELDPDTGDVVPAIAESWIISDGGRRITFKLRKGVRFHDGAEVTADDVLFSLSRLAERDFASPVASLLEPVIGYETIHGNEEATDDRFRTEIAGVRVIENFSFEVALTDEHAEFIRTLAHPATSPVSRKAAEADPVGFASRPACAGPYRLPQPWSPGTDITLERFADYHGANAAATSGGAGYPDTVVFRAFGDRAAQERAFRAGAVGVAFARETADGDGAVVVPTPSLEYIGLPTKVAPFDARAVRVALSQAIDRTALIDAVYGGAREPATGILPAAAGPVHRESSCGDRVPASGDVEAARATLAAAGVGLAGRDVQLVFNDEFTHRELARNVAEQWNAAFGLQTELVPTPWEDYLRTGIGQPGFEAAFRMTWTPQVPGPDAYLEPLFASGSIGRDNFTRFGDRDFDRSLERDARTAIDPQDTIDTYRDLETLVCGELPIIPLNVGARAYLIADGIGSALGERVASIATGSLLVRELFVRG